MRARMTDEQELQAFEARIFKMLDGVIAAIDCNDVVQGDIAADLLMACTAVCLGKARSDMSEAAYEAFVEEAVGAFRIGLLAAKHNLSVKSIRELKSDGRLQ